MDLNERATDLTKQIYEAYGSETGVLFGIPEHMKGSVRAVVKVTLMRDKTKD